MGTVESTSAEAGRTVTDPDRDAELGARKRFSVRRGLANWFVNGSAVVRLRSELATARPEFELLVDRVERRRAEAAKRERERERAEAAKRERDGDPPAGGEATERGMVGWVRRGHELLAEASESVERGSIEEAWRYLHTAKRVEIYGLAELDELAELEGRSDRPARKERGRSEVATRAAVVREEALDALGGWRRRAVVDLLCDEDGALRAGVTDSELRAATRILHEQYESVYLARAERQRQFNHLVVMGALSGLALLVLTLLDAAWSTSQATGLAATVGEFLETPFPVEGTEPDLTRPGFAVYMTVAGVMGASLFGMRSLRKRSFSTKIPQQVSQLTVTGARGVIGAISALLFYFVLGTPLLDGTILADGVLTGSLMVVVGFAAGYTERMVPDVVSRVASLTEVDERPPSDPGEGSGVEGRGGLESRASADAR
jgi:hypothetical protein